MKNQKKNSDKKSKENGEWITPEQASKILGTSFSIENTYMYRQKLIKEQENANK